MSSDEEEVDIWSSLVNNGAGPSSDEDSDNASDSENELGNVQDEIISSDEEEEEAKPAKKKQNQNSAAEKLDFPSLEIEDDESNSKAHDDDTYFIAQEQAQLGKGKNKGSFASFGLSKVVLSNIGKKGYRQPTPIQRKTIPLIMQNRDVVGMARTGSGKTAAFLLPLIEKLKTHSAKIGIRAIILSPSRELAVQTHKQFKEFSKGTDLRSLLLIGGDSLEDQFGAMVNNPDVVIATPGRFLHLKVEMRLDLSSIEFMVYDEADRLFEMGFAEQLNELLASLPEKRQSMLFSATLPRNLVDFAKAGLINPVLVRLDAESKISDALELSFFTVKKNEREANLLSILQDVIKMPQATKEQLDKLNDANNTFNDSDSDSENENNKKNSSKKRKLTKRVKFPKANELPSEHSTIVFVPTRHHVEYITNILKAANYPVSYIYGSLDQHARRQQLQNFRLGLSSIMVVTDVAARGIDIPVLANVINYTLPSSSKIFIHRVGRTARAGNKGWAYSIVSEQELPYLLDLEIFLGRKILLTKMHNKKVELLENKYKEQHGNLDGFKEPVVSYSKRIVLGSVPRLQVETMQDLYETILRHNYDIQTMRGVCEKAEKLYMRSRQPASQESMRRSKELVSVGWDEQNLLFGKNLEVEKDKFLAKLQNRHNKETVFEFGKRDDNLIDLMNKRRKQIAPAQKRMKERRELLETERLLGLSHTLEDEMLKDEDENNKEVGFGVNEDELLREFEDGDNILKERKTYKDPNFYMPHYAPRSVIQDQQLAVDGGNGNGGGNFISEASKAAFDIDAEDDKIQIHKQGPKVVWEKNKFVRKQDDRKFIISESGQRIPASFRSGKFEEWKEKHKIGNIRVGGNENVSSGYGNKFDSNLNGSRIGGRFKHRNDKAPKMPNKGRDDYDKQMTKVKQATERGIKVKGYMAKGSGRNEIRDSESIRKQRDAKSKRREKNARPSRKRK